MTGEQLREKRRQKGWTQAKLATLIGVSTNTIGNYEKGGTIPVSKKNILKAVFVAQLELQDPLLGMTGVLDEKLLSNARRKNDSLKYILQIVLSKFHPVQITEYIDENRERFEGLEEFEIFLANVSRDYELGTIKEDLGKIKKMMETMTHIKTLTD